MTERNVVGFHHFNKIGKTYKITHKNWITDRYSIDANFQLSVFLTGHWDFQQRAMLLL